GAFRGFDFIQEIAILPSDIAVFDEDLATRWQLNGIGGALVQEASDGPVFHGTRATTVVAEPKNFYTPWAVEFRPDTPIEPLGFAGIRFAFHPGDAELPNLPIFIIFIDGLGIDLVRDVEKFHIDFSKKEWQIIEIPFAAFNQPNYYGPGIRDQIDFVDVLRFEGNPTGTFHLDDVRLVTRIPSGPPAPTAVLAERGEGLPNELDLAQNFPNPFNSDTSIRFTLPIGSEIELSLYNLAGQQVSRLLHGWREPGRYTARWDGRTDTGHNLATGVYIYRLRAGDLVQSRKLLLLR
ncbi:MAG TPA: T9SS type A sorting domain-containing protein, partial [Candidatus Latescibacteria bacterium]|nr:T9SS type A sorting domain-containing protein [Candidatus Latescibacterota bacterium]